MTNYPRKRQSNVLGLIEQDEGPAPKTSRTAESFSLPVFNSFSTGRRFGERVDFMPLSQVPHADEEDADAAEIIDNSQDADESSLATSILYGASYFLLLLVTVRFKS